MLNCATLYSLAGSLGRTNACRYWDDDSQSYYFYSTQTGEASHEEPAEWTDAAAADGELGESDDPNMAVVSTPLLHDNDGGNIGVSDDPAAAKLALESAGSYGSAAGGLEDDAAGGGGADQWSMEWDDASQSYYYYNAATDAVSYEAPPGFEAASAATQGGDAFAAAAAAAVTSTEASSSDWTEHFDEASGQSYYYNATTDETSWEDPRDPAVVKSADLVDSWKAKSGGSGFSGTGSNNDVTKTELGHDQSKMIDVAAQFFTAADATPTYDDAGSGGAYDDDYTASGVGGGQYEQHQPQQHAVERWIQLWDDAQQAYYYQDTHTEDVVWEEPASYTPYDDAGAGGAAAAAASDVKFCTNCSKKLRATANFCRFCGNACS